VAAARQRDVGGSMAAAQRRRHSGGGVKVPLSRCRQIKIFHTLSRQYPIHLSAYQDEKVILFG
jgi:hypothetical protein